ncbi:MAG TPA: DUF3592 domain-containing protein [Gemmatimonadales bacterium]|nr:DUF3592 domain-containing protein [Gemmatimonadales bacterium]
MQLEAQILLACELAAVGGVIAVYREMRLARASTAWPAIPAKVLVARAVFLKGGHGGSSWMRLCYQYTVAGRNYVGTRYQFAHIWPSFRAMQEVASDLTARPDIVVHVDPHHPKRATIRAGLPRFGYALLAVGWVIVGTVTVLLITVRA